MAEETQLSDPFEGDRPELPLQVDAVDVTETTQATAAPAPIDTSVAYAILIVTFVMQIARVEGVSMAPTLADQDRLVVNKLIYRLHRRSGATW